MKPVSAAPEPLKPTNGNRSSVPVRNLSDPRSTKSLSDADWIKAREKEKYGR